MCILIMYLYICNHTYSSTIQIFTLLHWTLCKNEKSLKKKKKKKKKKGKLCHFAIAAFAVSSEVGHDVVFL